MRKIREKGMAAVFAFLASISIIAVLVICIFLFARGIPAIHQIGFTKFVSGKIWKPGSDYYGIFVMIIGSLYVTAGALIIGVPVGIFMAVFMAKFCPAWLYKILKPVVNLLAGIPSIIYGYFGLMVIVPFIRNNFTGNGFSILAASIVLGMMILPTIISVSEASIRAVPESYMEGALALGTTKETAVFKTIVPAAKSGIITSLTLGVGRAIGETMAVKMIVGNQTRLPESIFDGVRTLTSNIVLEMGYATDLHKEALIATGVILFGFILILNMIISILKRKQVEA